MSDKKITSETELWSFDPGNGRSITAKLSDSDMRPFSGLDLRWDDGQPVRGPIKLTPVDLQNLRDLISDYLAKQE
jgi:hypothetical protein